MTSSILPIDRTSLARQQEDAQSALARLQTLPCSTPDEAEFFESILSKAHEKGKLLESERQELTKPLQAQTKEIQDAFRPVERAYESLKALSKAKVSEYRTQLAIAAEASRNLAITAAQAGDTEACVAALAQVPTDVPSSFEWQVVETHVQDMPYAYLTPDVSALKRVCALATKEKQEQAPYIPGVVFRRVATVRVK